MDTTVHLADTHRMLWVDWMKVIGIYLIIVGHFSPIGVDYIYQFSVQLFFLVSGFLSKDTYEDFWKKLWSNLLLPTVIISFFSLMLHTGKDVLSHSFTMDSLLLWPYRVLIGDWSVLGGMWFVYSLAVMKLAHYLFRKKWMRYVLLLACIVMSIYLSYHKAPMNNAWLSAIVGYVFFFAGTQMRQFEHSLNLTTGGVNAFVIVVSLSLLMVCGLYNRPHPSIYQASYGASFVLYILGGFSGIVSVFALSKWLERLHHKWLITLSSGTIVILGFHIYFIQAISHITGGIFHKPALTSIWAYALSIVLLLLFIPIIQLAEKYFPYVVGKRKFK